MSSDVSVSVRGASYLALVQIGSRATTFALNQCLLRYITPPLLGVAVQLELISITILYFSRESIRVTLQRQTGNEQIVVNFAYISIIAWPLVTAATLFLYFLTSVPDIAYVKEAVLIFGLASLIELIAEPCFAVNQLRLRYGVRATAETLATITKGIATLACVRWGFARHFDMGVLPFALGELGFALVLCAVYYMRTLPLSREAKFNLYPTQISDENKQVVYFSLFSRPLCRLAANLYLQSGLKYCLTQGDSFVITLLASLQAQGAYAIATNYGGLIARVVFQPIEESSRNLFAKLCIQRPGEKTSAQSVRDLQQARQTLYDILRLYSLLALVAWVQGPQLAPLLLQLIAGKRWAETGAGETLAIYCYYIPVLALNGITEAFVTATADNPTLRRQSIMMVVYFVVFAGSSGYLLRTMDMGANGLIWASVITMTARLLWNGQFIRSFFLTNGQEFRFGNALPSMGSVGLSVVFGAVIHQQNSDHRLKSFQFEYKLAVMLGLTLIMVSALIMAEWSFLRSRIRMLKDR